MIREFGKVLKPVGKIYGYFSTTLCFLEIAYHRKHYHWRNRFRCVFQLSSIFLTNSIAVDSALANPLDSFPTSQVDFPLHSPVSEAIPPASPETPSQEVLCPEATTTGEIETIPKAIVCLPKSTQQQGKEVVQIPVIERDLKKIEEKKKSNDTRSFNTSLSFDTSLFSKFPTFQQQVVFSEANFLKVGDSLSVGYIHTEQSNSWDVRYTLPINTRDGTLSFAYSKSDVYALNLTEDNIDKIGNSSPIELGLRSYELTLRQPVIRSIKQQDSQQQEQQQTSEELALGLTASLNDDKLTRIFALRFFQEWKKQNPQEVIELRSQFSFGINSFDSTINQAIAEANQIPSTTFFSWQGQVEWSRFLAKDTLLLVRGNAQLTDRSLLPLEQFVPGGKAGYLQGSLLTDNGIFASAEVQLPILRVSGGKGVIQVVPFVDFGTAWNSSGQANPSPNTLASVGLGLQWQQDNFTARLDWGIPLVKVHSQSGTGQENGLYFSVKYNP